MNTVNKFTFLSVATAVALVVLTSTATFAQTNTPGVAARQQNEAARSNQGVASGELSKGEARTLRTEQRGIAAEKRAFQADGKVTKAERAQLRRDQNAASKRIYKKKHNTKKAA